MGGVLTNIFRVGKYTINVVVNDIDKLQQAAEFFMQDDDVVSVSIDGKNIKKQLKYSKKKSEF